MAVGFVGLEVVTVGVVALARGRGGEVLDDVAVLVEDEHHAEVARARGAVEQDELAHGRVELRQARRPQVVLDGLEREVDDLDVPGDVALDDLQEVAGGLLGLVPGVAPQVHQHQARDDEHADGREHAECDPGVGGAKPSRETKRHGHRRPFASRVLRCLVSGMPRPNAGLSQPRKVCRTHSWLTIFLPGRTNRGLEAGTLSDRRLATGSTFRDRRCLLRVATSDPRAPVQAPASGTAYRIPGM